MNVFVKIWKHPAAVEWMMVVQFSYGFTVDAEPKGIYRFLIGAPSAAG